MIPPFPIIVLLILLVIVLLNLLVFRKRGKYKIKILPFIGFGSRDSFQISGRVIIDRGDFISYALKEFSGKKFIRNYRRLRSINVPNVKLEINFFFKSEIVKTDEKGYYRINTAIDNKNHFPTGISKYSVKIIDDEYSGNEAFGDIVIIPDDVSYGIICDIDDTILQTNVQKKIRMVLNTFMSNERDMKPMPGMNHLLMNLHMGLNKISFNPIMYVTASPNELHDKIASFIKTNLFPEGPLLMKKIRGDNKDKLFDNYNYKLKQLRKVFDKFPKMKFILIGDNTESDVKTFNQIDREYSGRVKLILIMNIACKERNPEEYQKAVLCNTSFDAALECVKSAILSPASAYDIGQELKNYQILSPEVNIEKKIDQCLPIAVKSFRKFLKRREKYALKRREMFNKIFKRNIDSEE